MTIIEIALCVSLLINTVFFVYVATRLPLKPMTQEPSLFRPSSPQETQPPPLRKNSSEKRKPIVIDDFRAYQLEREEIERRKPTY